jgi:hypothetical protein
MTLDCRQHPILPPKVVAIATDTYLRPATPFPDAVNLPGVASPRYGQDITSGYRRPAPKKQDAGATPAILKPKMRRLLTIFASGDRTGMATRLFDAFLEDTCRLVVYFDDPALNAAAAAHGNINAFCNAALSAPNSPHRSPGKIRIHQALKNAGWDINKITLPTDLGVPAFNLGRKELSTEDFNNGLGVMINGIQHVYVVATHYHYDSASKQYCITLKYVIYDVFGLDDEDLEEFGAESISIFTPYAKIGITAWWQLQHQHGYAPLITRAIVEKTYVAPAQ